MIVIEKNEGPKIPFEVIGKKICFDDDLTINLAKRQKDDAEHIDICYDSDHELVIGCRPLLCCRDRHPGQGV